MTETKANPWPRTKVRGKLTYTHESGDWEIVRVKRAGPWASRMGFQYEIHNTGNEAHLRCRSYSLCASLKEAKAAVDHYIGQAKKALDEDPQRRAEIALEAGDQAAVLRCVFEHIDKRFDELEQHVDDRLNSLSISM